MRASRDSKRFCESRHHEASPTSVPAGTPDSGKDDAVESSRRRLVGGGSSLAARSREDDRGELVGDVEYNDGVP